MLSAFILAILVIALGAFLWYGWKKQKFGEHYEIFWIVSGLAIVLLGIWRGNPRPFNDRDESAACFFQSLGLFQAWSFSCSEKRNCLKQKKTVMIRVAMLY